MQRSRCSGRSLEIASDEVLPNSLPETDRFIDMFDIPRREQHQPLSLTARLSRLLQKLGVDTKEKRAQQPQNFAN